MAPDPMGSDGNHQHPALSSLAELGFQVRVLDRFCVVTEVWALDFLSLHGVQLTDSFNRSKNRLQLQTLAWNRAM